MTLENSVLEGEVHTMVPWADDYMDRFAVHNTPQLRVFVKHDLELIKKKCSREAYVLYKHVYDRIIDVYD